MRNRNTKQAINHDMSYSTSVKAFDKVKHFLDVLATATSDSVSWHSTDPNRLAYQIRQGMTIAASNPESYPNHKELRKTFKISVKGGQVVATRFVPLVEEVTVNVANFAKAVNIFEVPDVKEVMEAVGAVLANPSFEEYHFPDYTEIKNEELERLYRWTSKNQLFIIKSSFLILTKKEPPEDLAWKPN